MNKNTLHLNLFTLVFSLDINEHSTAAWVKMCGLRRTIEFKMTSSLYIKKMNVRNSKKQNKQTITKLIHLLLGEEIKLNRIQNYKDI